jgi:hypothetical protein
MESSTSESAAFAAALPGKRSKAPSARYRGCDGANRRRADGHGPAPQQAAVGRGRGAGRCRGAGTRMDRLARHAAAGPGPSYTVRGIVWERGHSGLRLAARSHDAPHLHAKKPHYLSAAGTSSEGFVPSLRSDQRRQAHSGAYFLAFMAAASHGGLNKNVAPYSIATLRSNLKSVNNLPVPRTTLSNGSSAIDTGNPVSSRIRLSKFFNIAPPPVKTIPWSLMSALSSGGVCSSATRIACMIVATHSASC